ncbi:MAG: translation initiation factor IF-3 [Candidatus Pacebacteria bacterium]|nr:translation initiation factor IF-3 [Candidatus Paceibacterota bacterium]
MRKRIIYNNFIRAPELRLIDESGQQLGVVSFEEAKAKAQAAGLDLIQVTEKIDPPVCKIMDYGKYAYQSEKKEKKAKHQKAGEMKNIRLTFAISEHDLETRAKAATEFLQKGYKVRLEMRLKGREKYLDNFSRDKINKLLNTIRQAVPVKFERELKKEPRGFSAIIAKE